MEGAARMLRTMLFLLMVLPILIVVLVVLTLATITGVRMGLHHIAVRWMRRQAYRETHDENGLLLPPVSRGVCQRCGCFSEDIYYLPDGSRVCKECYQPIEESASSRDAKNR